MKTIDSFKLSVNNIRHRKLRAWLTLLGIIIGVAAVVSIVSIGEGASASVSSSLSDFGADIIILSPGFNKASSFGSRKPGGFGREDTTSTDSPELGKHDVMIIKGHPNVQFVNEIVSSKGELVFLSESASVSIDGVNPNSWQEMNELKLEAGRFLGASDSTSIVIGYRLAHEIFEQEITIGRRVTIEDASFSVVGILEESGGQEDSKIYMNYPEVWDLDEDIEMNVFTSIQAKLYDVELTEETTEQLTQSLMISRKVTEKDQDFTISSAQAMQEQINEMIGTLTLFLGAIALVSLIVGAVGVANSMFTSVLEKTKEIGILKALGATEKEIMILFMIESALFGLFGGVIGIVLGVIVSMLINLTGVSFLGGSLTLVTPELMAVALALSIIIGVVSGLMPARSASKLRPIDALRYE